jgi:uncharacterized membrane protein
VMDWVLPSVGAVLAGLVIGRSLLRQVQRRESSPVQRTRRVRGFHGWVLLGLGVCMMAAALIGKQAWYLDIAVAAFCIPIGIAILISNRKSRTG